MLNELCCRTPCSREATLDPRDLLCVYGLGAQVKKARAELQEKLIAQTEDQRLAYETRMQAEVTRMQEQFAADVDKCATEMTCIL